MCEVNFNMYIIQLSNEKALGGGLGYIGDYTIQIFRDDNKPFINRPVYIMECHKGFERCSCV